jgi:hypothetical protein
VGVFLLSHRAGAAGLTLVRANHVFLLEPALDPSIEQQAVARVHRIGQQRWVGRWVDEWVRAGGGTGRNVAPWVAPQSMRRAARSDS